MQQFVCAVNRNRDGYQVPLALHEAGLLDRLVTDFYRPDAVARWLPPALRARGTAGLPSSRTRSSPVNFAIQVATQLSLGDLSKVSRVIDPMLARHAGRVAARRTAHLYCYAGYLPEERAIRPGTRRVVFQYHPLPQLSLAVLRDDFGRYPQVRHSWEAEASGRRNWPSELSWQRADAVVCASGMTRRSLEHAGCPPERIAVIPYGFEAPADALAAPVAAPRRRCEFLFVGQGVQRKGLHHLIEAWQASDLADARLTIASYWIDPGIAATIGSPSIRLLPRQSRDELDALYRSADVFVMPSLVEGFGLVYLEALARGCHLIGTENTGLPDLKLPAHAATVIAAGDVPGLAGALARSRDAALAGQLDRGAIRDAATAWRWADFRRGIAEHAGHVLAT